MKQGDDQTPPPALETERSKKIRSFDFGGITVPMFCPSPSTASRGKSALTKEPETIQWLDAIPFGSCVWDIGANVGVYSLYAALKRHCSVIAFEPAAANYLVLNRNIELNKLDQKISAYCIAVGPTSKIDHLYHADTDYGAALSNFGEAVDFQGRTFVPEFRQGCVSFKLDDLMEMLPAADHIKIDVDGLESEIVTSSPKFFSQKNLKSAMIELDIARPHLIKSVVDTMKQNGFKFSNENSDVRGRNIINAVFVR